MSARPLAPEILSKLPGKGELVGGKYRVEGTAGVGGMGVVLCARHEALGHQVAIKFLASEEDNSNAAVERFLREGRIVASLQSDHVVRIYDVGRLDSGIPYMVMELLRGRDLGEYIATEGAVVFEQAVDWLLQAIHAIAEAHECGIVHRDLKPSNLYLTQRSDGSDCVKVLDFGISKRIAVQDPAHAAHNLTSTRQIVGSPAYMSPEQVRNARDVDHRVDIWALGMTLYELLAGRTAFDAETFPAVCAAIVTEPPPSLRKFVPDIPQGLENVVMRCLEKDPARRFASVTALANELRPHASRAVQSASRRRQQSFTSEAAISGANPSTLVSSRTPDPAGHNLLVRSSDIDEPFSNRTMNSADIEVNASQSRALSSVAVASRINRLLWPFLALLGFASVAVWKLKISRPQGTPVSAVSTGAAVSNPSEHFAILVQSDPAGAEVWDEGSLLGYTPLTLSLQHSMARAAPRKFILKKDGFEPFTAVQGDAPHDVVIAAKLSVKATLSAAAPSTLVAPPQTKKSPKSGPASKAERTAKAPGSSSPNPESEIRTKR